MPDDRRLLPALWRAAFSSCIPFILFQALIVFVDHGISWATLSDAVVFVPVVLVFASGIAVYRAVFLRRQARGTGIPVTADALRDTWTHTLEGVPFPCVRAALSGAERAFDVVSADGGNPVRLRWRPFRARLSVQVAVTFDETTGSTRLETTAGERLSGLSLARQAGAFVALCQMVRAAGSVEKRRP